MFDGLLNILLIVVILAIILLVIFIALPSSKRRKAAFYAAEEQRRRFEESLPVSAPVPEPVPDSSPSINVPMKYQDKTRVYFYPDVKILGFPGGADLVIPGDPLSFSCSDEYVQLFQGSNLIGQMIETRLAGMVRDWEKAGDPVLAYVVEYSDDGSSAMIALAFYQDLLAKFLKKNPHAKLYKLAGSPDELASDYEPGCVCSVESDFDNPDKYFVVFDGSPLGRLPVSAVRYAEEQGYEPEDLDVIVASVAYDDEKGRDVISVYID